MKKIFQAIYYIYLNRYRFLSHEDFSKFPILVILFLGFNVYLFSNISFNILIISLFLIISLSFSALIDRKDENLLLELFGSNQTKLIKFIDIFILNFSFLILLLFNNKYLFFGAILYLGFISCFKISFSKTKLSLPFYVFDPIWICYFRKNPINILGLFLIYFIAYKGISIKNYELFEASFLGISFIFSQIINNSEHLFFLKISKLSAGNILIKSGLNSLKNSLILFVPIFIICLVYFKFPVGIFLNSIFIIVIINYLKFIYFNNSFLQSIFSLFLILGSYFFIKQIDSIFLSSLILLFFVMIFYKYSKLKLEKLVL